MTTETYDSQSVLLIDDDVMVTEGLAAALECNGRTLITCNDLETAELIVERFHPSHIVTDVRLSGPFAYEGLALLPYVQKHAPDTRVILMSGDASDALQREASTRGAAAFLQKPFEMDDLDATLALMTPSPSDSSESCVIRVPTLDDVLASDGLETHFQPIVTLHGRETFAFESLARYRTDSPLRNPEMLFAYAAKKKRIADLEFACINATATGAGALPGAPLLFMNVHPEVFSTGQTLVRRMKAAAANHGLPLDRVVIEVTEQASLPGTPIALAAVEALREIGIRFAFDDVGAAYSHLPLIAQVRPSFLKISQEFGQGFESDTTKTKIVRNIVALASDFGCDVVLEGIEEESTAAAAARAGIKYGQGYLFGRPSPSTSYSGGVQ